MSDSDQHTNSSETPEAKQLGGEIATLRTLLAEKDHELQLEAALENVRTVAMRMNKPDDMLDICKMISVQLTELGVQNIRNVQTAIFNTERATYVNYEYYTKHEKEIITETSYQNNELHSAFAEEMLKGAGKVFIRTIPHDELADWIAYQKTTNVFIDAFLETAPSLTYHWYSLGSVALGISTYEPLSEKELHVFKRFKNVFELAYTRHTDIEKALAQAREAQIEAALERVRSRAMAMRSSDELNPLIGSVFTELTKLDLLLTRCAILIFEDEKNGYRQWMINSETPSIPTSLFVKHSDLPYFTAVRKGFDDRALKWEYILEGDNKFVTDEFLFTESELSRFPDFVITAMRAPERVYISASFNNFGCIILASLEPLGEENFDILLRFSKVFELTYTRFNDLKQAEAQARETQIELSLERVRAKAMSMQSSQDVNDAVKIVFEEMEKLHLGLMRCGIGILSKAHRTADVWTTSYAEGVQMQTSGDESVDIHPLLQGAHDAWMQQHDFDYTLEGDDLLRYYGAVSKTNYRLREARAFIEAAKASDAEHPLRHYYYVTPFESGNLFAFCETPFSAEAKNILQRFAGVFNLTYTRYLDLKKAEAQAKEAELERKRSESLLLNILPADIAAELKQFGKSYARKHEQVTILFSDIKGFSTISETLSADELVNQLDECFRAFDHIVEKHGLEKIKTIGDAYVCACGLPNPDPDHAIKTIRAALDMLAFAKGFGMTKKIQDLPVFDFRFGIHSGPVVTGVVGAKKFTYDIWGDAVNMAARMEQHGEAGKINISGATYELVKDKFTCTHRGKIAAKNKGMVDMYFVEG